MYKRLLSAVLLLGLVSFGFGQAVGKLSGVVKDRETGEPLPGVNVVIQETFLGASTDVDGYYVILNVSAGTHTVSFSYIGYQSVEVENVRVVIDITKRLNMELEPTAIELEDAVVVVAERPFFEVGATNTVRVLDSEEIERVPLKGVNSIVAVNAGVVIQDGSGGETDNAEINVRGGRGNETLFVVDGVPYNDALFGDPVGTIPDNAVEQISTQLGGFSAKYGSAQSGVVNIVTKSGGSKYNGGIEAITSQITDDYGYNLINASLSGPLWPGNKTFSFFGIYEYGENDDENPRAIDLNIPATTYRVEKSHQSGEFYVREFPGVQSTILPDNASIVRRFTGKIDASLFEKLKLTWSGSGSSRDYRTYTDTYAKNNSYHNLRHEDNVLSSSLKISHVLNETTYWDAVVRYKWLRHREGDGAWFDNVDAYGDTLANQERFPHLDFFRSHVDPATGNTVSAIQGSRQTQDEIGIYFDEGRVNNRWRKYTIETFGGNFNFVKQWEKHLIEIGGTLEQNKVRYYNIAPTVLAIGLRDNPQTDSQKRKTK
jgi:outer membrane receptor protein involved in Fe transport